MCRLFAVFILDAVVGWVAQPTGVPTASALPTSRTAISTGVVAEPTMLLSSVDVVATITKDNVNGAVEFMAEYLPAVNPEFATKEKADELRAKVTAQAYKNAIVNDGLSSVFHDSDGAIRAVSFGRKVTVGAEDVDVYIGEREMGTKMGKLAMLAQWQEQDESLRPDQCLTFGYLSVDIAYFPTPRGAGAVAVKLLDHSIESARTQDIKHIRSPSQGLFKDAVLSQHIDFAIWSANGTTVSSAYEARFTNEYLKDWNEYATRPNPCNQWMYVGSLVSSTE